MRVRWPIILNHTSLRNQQIRRLICAALRRRHIRPKALGLKFHIKWKPPGQTMLGWATCDEVCVYVRKAGTGRREEFIHTLEHELDHIEGYDHYEMRWDSYCGNGTRNIGWADGYPLDFPACGDT